MKFIFTLFSLFYFATSFSQWTRVTQLPATNIASLYHKDYILYAGGENVIYISKDKGATWDSTSVIPDLFLITGIIVFKNEIYAVAPHRHVAKSSDGGATWKNILTGNDTLFVSDFCEFKGDLYASTLGDAVFKLDPATRNGWLPFRNGLSNLSENATAIEGNSNALIAGTIANGMYDYLAPNSTIWEERFLLNQISPNEGAFDIITAHDTLFLAGETGRYYMSTNNGQSWNLFGNRLKTGNTTLINAKQALVSSIYFFDGSKFLSVFFYIKKDSLQNPFVNFSIIPNHFTWKMDIIGDNLWHASDEGLFFMPLSALPGITAADEPVPIILPLRFVSFNANCEENKVKITWRTAQEQNSSHFNIERSIDGTHWTVIGNVPAQGKGSAETNYSFTNNSPVQNGYYRIGEYDLDGKVQYTNVLQSSCNTTDIFKLWPNPIHDMVFINIVTGNESQSVMQLFDSKGALIKTQRATLLPGSSQITVDMSGLANGIYSLSIVWNNGQSKKALQVLKQ